MTHCFFFTLLLVIFSLIFVKHQAFLWIFCARVIRGFSKNGVGELLPALRFLGGLYNFCNFVIGRSTLVGVHPVKLLLFSLMKVTMICRTATYFTDLEMIECYQTTCDWNSKSTKTKKYIKNYARYTTLKNNSLCFTFGRMALL